MTRLEFYFECGKRLIDDQLALENENIIAALDARDDKKVLEILDNEF